MNAYEIKAGICVIAGKTERLECEVLQKEHYINTLTLLLPIDLLMKFEANRGTEESLGEEMFT